MTSACRFFCSAELIKAAPIVYIDIYISECYCLQQKDLEPTLKNSLYTVLTYTERLLKRPFIRFDGRHTYLDWCAGVQELFCNFVVLTNSRLLNSSAS